MKKINLTGKRFGRLVVISESPEPYVSPSGQKTRRWLCKCDCGNEVTVLQNALTASHNPTRSCGCARAESIRKLSTDLTGKRYGRLTILKKTDLKKPDTNGNRLGWVARCDCGNEIVVSYKNLLSGRVLSCGCLLRETAIKKMKSNVMGYLDGTEISAIKPGRGPNKNNKSGHRGVYWSNREQRYIAKIQIKGRTITIGRFTDLDSAVKARASAEDKYFMPEIERYKKGKK